MAVGSTSSSAITAQMISATSKPFVELVTCDVVLRELGDEKASVSITVLSDFSSTQRNSSSTKSRSYETSIDKGTVFAMPLALPSIMTLDLDLVKEFFNNVLENMQLLHDRSTDKIVLCLKD